MHPMRLRLAVATALLVSAVGAAVASATPGPYVYRCGTKLCQGGSTFAWNAASALTGPADPKAAVALATGAGLDVVRVVDFLDVTGNPTTAPYDATRWQRVDALIATAGAAGLRVELDLSTYRNLLAKHGINPYTYDWSKFVRFVTARKNTVSGRVYATDPTIAVVAFAGEVEPPAGSSNTLKVTTAQITSFFSRTMALWRSRDAYHLLTPGGLLQLDWSSGIDWQAIMSLPSVDVCALHVYGLGDQTTTVPQVSKYCAALGKPWITEEFGYNQQDGDSLRATEFSQMYALQATYHSAGSGFWNLGPQVSGDTFDVNSGTPLTWSVVRSHVSP
jgi:hypothetical protein